MEANHSFLLLLCYLKSKLTSKLIHDYTLKYKKRCEEYVFKHTIKTKHLGFAEEENPLELFEWMAAKRWEMIEQPIYDKIPVEDVTNE